MKTYLFPTWIRLLFPTAMFCLLPTALKANDLAVLAGGFADAVNKHFEDTNQNKIIKIGKFTASHDPQSNVYGTRIAIAIEKELKRFEIKVDDGAEQRIEGTFSVNDAAKVVKVKAAIVRRSGKSEQLLPVELEIKNTETSSELATPSLPTEPAAVLTTSEDSLDAALDRVVKPLEEAEIKDDSEFQFADGETSGGSIKIDKQGDYLVFGERLGVRLREIRPMENRSSPNFFGPRMKPLSTKAPHFRLRENACYIIELKNYKSDVDLATKILFDGIDTSAFSEEAKDKDKLMWIVPMKKNVAVYGWHRNDANSDAFQIVPDAQSVAHRFGSLDKGRIQINIYAAWDPAKRNDVPEEFKLHGIDRGVGQGVRMPNEIKRVKSEIGKFLGDLVIGYDHDRGTSQLVKK